MTNGVGISTSDTPINMLNNTVDACHSTSYSPSLQDTRGKTVNTIDGNSTNVGTPQNMNCHTDGNNGSNNSNWLIPYITSDDLFLL